MSLPSGRPWAAVGLLAWTAFLAGTLAVLHDVGGPLAPPPLTDPAGWGGWLEGREPSEAAVAGVRLAVLGLAWYLLAVTVAGTLARLTGARLLVRAADAVTLPLVRRLVGGAVGVSVATAASFTGAPSAAASGHLAQSPPAAATVYHPPPAPGTGADSPPTMQRLPGPPAAPADSFRATIPPPAPAPAGADSTPRATTPLPPPSTQAPGAQPATTPPAPPPTGAQPVTTPPAPPPTGAQPATTPPAPPPTGAGNAGPRPPATWTVRPGDHFWAVAERVLAEAWGWAPSDREVDPYWRSLVEANRSVLRDPANPDLLFPGQVIQLAPPPAAPAP